MCRWPGYGFQAFEFRTGYINQENNVGNRVNNYIKLGCNKFSWETYGHVSNTRNSIFGFSTGIQLRTGYQNQAKSSLEQGQVSGGPATHPTKISVQYPPSPPGGRPKLNTWPGPGNDSWDLLVGSEKSYHLCQRRTQSQTAFDPIPIPTSEFIYPENHYLSSIPPEILHKQ